MARRIADFLIETALYAWAGVYAVSFFIGNFMVCRDALRWVSAAFGLA